MNRSSFALFVALLIHFVFLVIFWFLGSIIPDVKKQNKENQRIKVSLKEMPKKEVKNSGVIKKKKPLPKIAPPMPKGNQLKEIIKSEEKPFIKYKKKKVTPTPIKNISIPPIYLDKKEPLNKYIKVEKEKSDPMAWLKEDKSSQEQNRKKNTKKSNTIGLSDSSIKELYGSKFGELTQGQQKYILDNQEIMRRITQQILTRVARVNLNSDINVNRTNVIEFYLHPNGDMTDFKFLKKSGYFVLDHTTQETIEYAYSRYPRPKEKTLIRYNVFYNLARY